MEELRRQLAALDPDQVRQLLSASGHDALVADTQQPAEGSAGENRGGSSEKVDVAATKAAGNAAFKDGQYEAAAEAYTRCIEASDAHDATLYSNRAMANLKLERYQAVVEDCTIAIRIAPSIKPFLRRATAYQALLNQALAVEDLEAALHFEPTNREALRLLQQISQSPVADRHTRLRAILLLAFREGWKQVPVKGNPAPPALNGHVLFSVPGDLRQLVFLHGGRSVRDQKHGVFAMDDSDYSWDLASSSNPPPSSRAWHTVSSIAKDMLCVYGGVSGQGEDPSVHVAQAISTPSGYSFKWRTHYDTTSSPMARSGHSAASIRSHEDSYDVFVFGGRTKRGVSDELWVLQTVETESRTLGWKRIERANGQWPSPRDGHSMVIHKEADGKDELIVFGGNGQLTEDKMNDVWAFSPRSGQWTELVCHGEVPPPRSYHSSHVIGDFMIVVGGRMVEAEDSSVYLLDIVDKEWLRVPIPDKTTMIPRAWHASILRNDANEIYVIGGGTFNGPSRDAAVLDLAKFKQLTKDL